MRHVSYGIDGNTSCIGKLSPGERVALVVNARDRNVDRAHGEGSGWKAGGGGNLLLEVSPDRDGVSCKMRESPGWAELAQLGKGNPAVPNVLVINWRPKSVLIEVHLLSGLRIKGDGCQFAVRLWKALEKPNIKAGSCSEISCRGEGEGERRRGMSTMRQTTRATHTHTHTHKQRQSTHIHNTPISRWRSKKRLSRVLVRASLVGSIIAFSKRALRPRKRQTNGGSGRGRCGSFRPNDVLYAFIAAFKPSPPASIGCAAMTTSRMRLSIQFPRTPSQWVLTCVERFSDSLRNGKTKNR